VRSLSSSCLCCLVHLRSLKEHYNTAYDCVFLSAAATDAQQGLLLAAYHSGDIRWESFSLLLQLS
jgi:hypothetical protein